MPSGYKNTYTVDPETGCWNWPKLDKWGYGSLKRGQVSWVASRWFYTEANGPIPDGMTVDHLCFNPACVNPAHLRLLTPIENAKNQRSAMKTECSNGHPYTPENTYVWSPKSSPETRRRTCRTCQRTRTRKYYAERKLRRQEDA